MLRLPGLEALTVRQGLIPMVITTTVVELQLLVVVMVLEGTPVPAAASTTSTLVVARLVEEVEGGTRRKMALVLVPMRLDIAALSAATLMLASTGVGKNPPPHGRDIPPVGVELEEDMQLPEVEARPTRIIMLQGTKTNS